MNQNEVAFLQRLIADKAEERRAGSTSIKMAEVEGIGRLRGSAVRYAERDLLKASNLLLTRGFQLEAPAEPVMRSQASGAGSEKINALRVSDRMVAVVPIGLEDALPYVPGCFMAMPVAYAAALPYEVLLVSENLEPLRLIHQYNWLARFVKQRPALAIFRGAPGYFRTDVASDFIKRDTRPTLAFFDFDPRGLSMAASLPRREALCLPPLAELEAEASAQKRAVLFTNSFHQSRVHLDGVKDVQIALAWKSLRRLAVGLGQENFPR